MIKTVLLFLSILITDELIAKVFDCPLIIAEKKIGLSPSNGMGVIQIDLRTEIDLNLGNSILELLKSQRYKNSLYFKKKHSRAAPAEISSEYQGLNFHPSITEKLDDLTTKMDIFLRKLLSEKENEKFRLFEIELLYGYENKPPEFLVAHEDDTVFTATIPIIGAGTRYQFPILNLMNGIFDESPDTFSTPERFALVFNGLERKYLYDSAEVVSPLAIKAIKHASAIQIESPRKLLVVMRWGLVKQD